MDPPDGCVWTQQWSGEHRRPFYHNPATQESVWDAPVDAVVRELENIAQLQAEAALARASPLHEPDVGLLTMSVLLPLLLVLAGLYALFRYVRVYHPELGLHVAHLRRKQRDRAQHRRGRTGGSTFRPPWKMAQAGGAGGRSANS